MDRSLGKPFQCRQLQIVASPHAAQTTQCQMTISLAKIRGRLQKLQGIITLFCLKDPSQCLTGSGRCVKHGAGWQDSSKMTEPNIYSSYWPNELLTATAMVKSAAYFKQITPAFIQHKIPVLCPKSIFASSVLPSLQKLECSSSGL